MNGTIVRFYKIDQILPIFTSDNLLTDEKVLIIEEFFIMVSEIMSGYRRVRLQTGRTRGTSGTHDQESDSPSSILIYTRFT